jgi:hypothetical protein
MFMDTIHPTSTFMSNIEQANEADSQWVKLVQAQVGSLKFGVVQIVVHDSRVVQIERTEKYRLERGQTDKGERVNIGWLE